MRTPGNTPGGMNAFLIGLMITVMSSLNLAREVHAYGGFFSLGLPADQTFLVILAALFVGIVLLFLNGKNLLGQLLGLGCLLAIVVGTLVYIGTYYREGQTWNVIFGLFGTFAGVGLIFRAVLPMPPPKSVSR